VQTGLSGDVALFEEAGLKKIVLHFMRTSCCRRLGL